MKQTVKTSRVAGQLEKMFRGLNERFFENELPEVVISLKKTVGAYGHFTTEKIWKAGENQRYEINISSATLDRPIEETCATLVHEMCHLYAQIHDIKDCSNHNVYHNARFREIAEAHGLDVKKHDKYGWTITTANIDLLIFIEEQGWQPLQMAEAVSLYELIGTGSGRSTGTTTTAGRTSSTRKYTCPVCGNSCRATKVINLICGDCMTEMISC